jgi:hypothetical protein
MNNVFLCVSIDCECDKGKRWRTQHPLSFHGVTEAIVNRLQPMFRSYGAKPTYLLSPELFQSESAIEAMRTIDGSCELGTHLHGEYVEPGAYSPRVTLEVQGAYEAAVEQQKMSNLTALFVDAFGRRPRSFRAGRFGIGVNTIPILESLGYWVDSSVTPNLRWGFEKLGLPSFAGASTQPYRPDRSNPARVGSATVLEVPVTVHRVRNDNVWARLLPARWLRPTFSSRERLIAVARAEIAAALAASPAQPVILNAMLHNVELMPGASPYAASEKQASKIQKRLAALLEFARSEAITTIGLADIPDHCRILQ